MIENKLIVLNLEVILIIINKTLDVSDKKFNLRNLIIGQIKFRKKLDNSR